MNYKGKVTPYYSEDASVGFVFPRHDEVPLCRHSQSHTKLAESQSSGEAPRTLIAGNLVYTFVPFCFYKALSEGIML